MGIVELVEEKLKSAHVVKREVYPFAPHPIPRFRNGEFDHYEYVENHSYFVVPKNDMDLTNPGNLERFMQSLKPKVPRSDCYSASFRLIHKEVNGKSSLYLRMGYLIFFERLGFVLQDVAGNQEVQLLEKLPDAVMNHRPADHFMSVYNRYVTLLPFPHEALASDLTRELPIEMIEAYNTVFDEIATQPGY